MVFDPANLSEVSNFKKGIFMQQSTSSRLAALGQFNGNSTSLCPPDIETKPLGPHSFAANARKPYSNFARVRHHCRLHLPPNATKDWFHGDHAGINAARMTEECLCIICKVINLNALRLHIILIRAPFYGLYRIEATPVRFLGGGDRTPSFRPCCLINPLPL